MTTSEPTLDSIAEVFTVASAAEATRLSTNTIRTACRTGELPAFIPGGRPTRTPGRGMGYRILRADLQSWFFGQMRGEA